MFDEFVDATRGIFSTDEFIPLHEPRFIGNERTYVLETIESTFVSSVGAFVDRFEAGFRERCQTTAAVAVVNGTAGIHASLLALEVGRDHEVITQPLTFVATANAISHCGAIPVFVDVETTSLSMCPQSLSDWLKSNAEVRGGRCFNKTTGRKISACMPMHTFGLVAFVQDISAVCEQYCIPVLEDAAEALGSTIDGLQVGVEGRIGVFSFNGNKIVTTGGGGMIVTNAPELGSQLKHLTTTAKQSHPWEYFHDQVGYNYRMPNLNAALGCAQMESLEKFVARKRQLHGFYKESFSGFPFRLISERAGTESNYWLNAILLDNPGMRDDFLKHTNGAGVMTRPVWRLLTELPMYSCCQSAELTNAQWLQERVINIPSSVLVQ